MTIKNKLPKNAVDSDKTLSDLTKDDLVFGFRFFRDKIYDVGWYRLTFVKKDDDGLTDYISVTAKTKDGQFRLSTGVDKCVMSQRFFMDKGCSHNEFFTLDPQTWKDDLITETLRVCELERRILQNELDEFIETVDDLVTSKPFII